MRVAIGTSFGRWTVVARTRPGDAPRRRAHWWCRCVCGTERLVLENSLKRRESRSCGCAPPRITGPTGGHRLTGTPEWNAWSGMVGRCHVKSDSAYARYGAQGVAVCDRWRRDFLAFLQDVGPKPSPNHTIDRLDNSKGYEPSNVRWATPTEQARNTRRNRLIEIDGESKCLAAWAEVSAVSYTTIRDRLNRGWPPKRAVFQPTRNSTQAAAPRSP